MLPGSALVLRQWLALQVLSFSVMVLPVAAQDCIRISEDDWHDIQFFRHCLKESNPHEWTAPSGNTLLHSAAGLTRNPTIVVCIGHVWT